MVVLLSNQKLSVAFRMQTMKTSGKLTIESEERSSRLSASLSPVARPNQNKVRECGPQIAGELGWTKVPEFWSLPGQGGMVFCQMPGQGCHEKETSALSFYRMGAVGIGVLAMKNSRKIKAENSSS